MRHHAVATALSRSRHSPVICGGEIEVETPITQAMLQALTNTMPMPNSPAMAAVWDALGQMIVQMVNQEDPARCAANTKAAIQSMVYD